VKTKTFLEHQGLLSLTTLVRYKYSSAVTT